MTTFQKTEADKVEKPLKALPPPKKKAVAPEMGCLYDILRLKRCHNGQAENILIQDYIKPTGAKRDKFGNFILDIPKPDGSLSKVMWSVHTDTVHHSDGVQRLMYNKDNGQLSAAEITYDAKTGEEKVRDAECLGADDGAGIWLALEMIKANVPGLYIFHRQEEIGCKGSKALAKDKRYTDRIKECRFAVAFDRRGYGSIITKQGSRSCSDTFANSLARQLLPMEFKPDPTGMYTDTKSYSDLIGECTNISVGYFNAHSGSEYLDLPYISALRDRLICINEEELVASRKPGEVESYTSSRSSNNNSGTRHYGYGSEDYYGHMGGGNYASHTRGKVSYMTLDAAIRCNVPIIADILEELGYTRETLNEEIEERTKGSYKK